MVPARPDWFLTGDVLLREDPDSHTRRPGEPDGASPFVIPPPPVNVLPVSGSVLLYPVRRIYCVGRNYAAHALELGHDPDREPPFFFQKNPDNLVPGDDVSFPYPEHSSEVHHEVELVVALSDGGREISEQRALDCVWGYAVGLDMTRRDLQNQAKQSGRPWEAAKAFEHSAPCSPLVPAASIGHPRRGAIWLDVNGERRQQGDLDQLIWTLPQVIARLSRLFELRAGDLIMTGTPAGVGPVLRGDVVLAGVHGVGCIKVHVG